MRQQPNYLHCVSICGWKSFSFSGCNKILLWWLWSSACRDEQVSGFTHEISIHSSFHQQFAACASPFVMLTDADGDVIKKFILWKFHCCRCNKSCTQVVAIVKILSEWLNQPISLLLREDDGKLPKRMRNVPSRTNVGKMFPLCKCNFSNFRKSHFSSEDTKDEEIYVRILVRFQNPNLASIFHNSQAYLKCQMSYLVSADYAMSRLSHQTSGRRMCPTEDRSDTDAGFRRRIHQGIPSDSKELNQFIDFFTSRKYHKIFKIFNIYSRKHILHMTSNMHKYIRVREIKAQPETHTNLFPNSMLINSMIKIFQMPTKSTSLQCIGERWRKYEIFIRILCKYFPENRNWITK